MKITMTSESPIVSPSEKGVINYYLHQKICTVICGNAIFTIGSSADLEILCGRLFSRLVNFFSFKFMHKFSTQVVDVKSSDLCR